LISIIKDIGGQSKDTFSPLPCLERERARRVNRPHGVPLFLRSSIIDTDFVFVMPVRDLNNKNLENKIRIVVISY